MFFVDTAITGDLSRNSEDTPGSKKEALKSYLDTRTGLVSFDDIRGSVSTLARSEDGELHQACFDSGFSRVISL